MPPFFSGLSVLEDVTDGFVIGFNPLTSCLISYCGALLALGISLLELLDMRKGGLVGSGGGLARSG